MITAWHYRPQRPGMARIKAELAAAQVLIAVIVPPTERLR